MESLIGLVCVCKGEKDYHKVTPETYNKRPARHETRQQSIQQMRHSFVGATPSKAAAPGCSSWSSPVGSVSSVRSSNSDTFFNGALNASASSYISCSSPEAYYSSSSDRSKSFSAAADLRSPGSNTSTAGLFRSPTYTNLFSPPRNPQRSITFASPVAEYRSYAPSQCASSVGRSPFSLKKTFPPEVFQATRLKNGNISAKKYSQNSDYCKYCI